MVQCTVRTLTMTSWPHDGLQVSPSPYPLRLTQTENQLHCWKHRAKYAGTESLPSLPSFTNTLLLHSRVERTKKQSFEKMLSITNNSNEFFLLLHNRDISSVGCSWSITWYKTCWCLSGGREAAMPVMWNIIRAKLQFLHRSHASSAVLLLRWIN